MTGLILTLINAINVGLGSLNKLIVTFMAVFLGSGGSAEGSLLIKIMNSVSPSNSDISSYIMNIIGVILTVVVFADLVQEFISMVGTDTYTVDAVINGKYISSVVKDIIYVAVVGGIFVFLFISNNYGWELVKAVINYFTSFSYTVGRTITTTASTTTASTTLTLSGVEDIGLSILILLMNLGLLQGMLNAVSVLISNFIIGIVGIIFAIVVMPIQIYLSVIGRISNPSRTLILLINSILILAVIIGMGQAIASFDIMSAINFKAKDAAEWGNQLVRFILFMGMLEVFRRMVMEANSYLSKLIMNAFELAGA